MKIINTRKFKPMVYFIGQGLDFSGLDKEIADKALEAGFDGKAKSCFVDLDKDSDPLILIGMGREDRVQISCFKNAGYEAMEIINERGLTKAGLHVREMGQVPALGVCQGLIQGALTYICQKPKSELSIDSLGISCDICKDRIIKKIIEDFFAN